MRNFVRHFKELFMNELHNKTSAVEELFLSLRKLAHAIYIDVFQKKNLKFHLKKKMIF